MKEERGKLLFTGVTGRWYDTVKGQKKKFMEAVIVCFINIGVIYLSTNFWEWWITSILLITLGVCVLGLYVIGGFEIDGIYEYGITNSTTTLGERLRGKSFHWYKNITKIGHGVHNFPEGSSEFIVIYEHNSEQPTIPHYRKINYKNDFYQMLVKILREKCPNAMWEEVGWMKLPMWKK